ncbi:MAG: hypothetical protein ABIG68_05930 [Acidobacteriota bacterium]
MDTLQLARYQGEKFPLILTFSDRDTGGPLAITGAELSMILGSIEKDDLDFDKGYGGRSNCARVIIDETDTATEGVFVGQATVTVTPTGSDELIQKSDPIKLVIMSGTAALTIEDIRLELRDTAKLNDVQLRELLSNEDLMRARMMAVDEWNAQPGEHTSYTSGSFPATWVGAWRKGAKAEALYILANNWRLNRMVGAAGGLSVDEKASVEQIEAVADKLKAQWLEFVRGQQYYETLKRSFTTLSGGL